MKTIAALSGVPTFTEAGTQKTKFRVLLGVKRDPDWPYQTSVGSGTVITVVR